MTANSATAAASDGTLTTVIIGGGAIGGFDETGRIRRTLPDGQSAGSLVAALLPASSHYVKALGASLRTRSRAAQTANRGACCSTPLTTISPR